jgi:PPOX class probable F420-dependent enzyme
MDEREARRSLAEARVGRLATVTRDGRPHLVPIVFAVEDDHLYSVVDDKPKRTAALRRLDNIAANPAVSVLVDHYEEDWRRLWWVRADGRARVVSQGPELERGLTLLEAKYAQYRGRELRGPAVVVEIIGLRSWSSHDP